MFLAVEEACVCVCAVVFALVPTQMSGRRVRRARLHHRRRHSIIVQITNKFQRCLRIAYSVIKLTDHGKSSAAAHAKTWSKNSSE